MTKRKPNKKQHPYHHKVDNEGNLQCPTCKEWKKPSEFNKNKFTTSGSDVRCRRCAKSYNMKRIYGITIDEYDKMFEEQNGVCAICSTFEVENTRGRLCIDHDHRDGRVRGLLCIGCNTAIGSLKDDINLFLEAIKYLQK